VRKLVVDAAGSVPQNAARERPIEQPARSQPVVLKLVLR
jgi:hypothetical protein